MKWLLIFGCNSICGELINSQGPRVEWWRQPLLDSSCLAESFGSMARNIFGRDLVPCSTDPMTGFFRTGVCDTCADDLGMHTVCARMTEDFLQFSFENGNDLITPRPEYSFPGLKSGDFWCVCLNRWIEALESDVAPPLKLEATHASVLEFVDMDILNEHASS